MKKIMLIIIKYLQCKTTLNVPAINIRGETKILVEENGRFE